VRHIQDEQKEVWYIQREVWETRFSFTGVKN